ncbi:hypothetical protein L9F63_002363 [Diploptera punctata]|uniref:Peroxisome biogenesis factor 2 n=1 Tax=Diploptera punctata TaxID=6984 RepID=A0AAD8A286_DIPPU|nr:hypothetical protein L9F63_002363 [Diploptera punctata]
MNSKEHYVSRVTQLDAVELDDEIVNILKHQVANVAKFMPFGFLGRYDPEINAALRFVIWKFSVAKVYGTFGQQLLSMKYGGDLNKNKAELFALLTIGTRYLKERSHEVTNATGNFSLAQKMKLMFSWAEIFIHVANLMNLLIFLREGKYPTLVDRVLGLQPVSVAPPGQNRAVGYSYMTRELLWHGFIEFLIFAIPLINYHSVKRKLFNLMPWKKKRKDIAHRRAVYTLNTKCAACNEHPVIPHHMGCSHVFCFYCLKANVLADEKYECPLCGFSAGDATLVIPL